MASYAYAWVGTKVEPTTLAPRISPPRRGSTTQVQAEVAAFAAVFLWPRSLHCRARPRSLPCPGSPTPPGASLLRTTWDRDRRRLIHSKGAIVMKVRLLDPAVPQRDFAAQGGTEIVHDSALDLRLGNVRIEDLAAEETRRPCSYSPSSSWTDSCRGRLCPDRARLRGGLQGLAHNQLRAGRMGDV